jgi:glycerophosphoryl diester phosphodiesterase
MTVPALPRAFLCDTFDDDTLPQAVELGCVALDAKHTLLDAEVIKRARDAKLRVVAWTVNDATRMEELRALGIDTIITDAIDVIGP